MREALARNISRYREAKHCSQEELAAMLHVSFQDVLRWERGQALPDSALLPELAKVLGVCVDTLLGDGDKDRLATIYEEEYKTAEYYWGLIPSKMCYKVLELMPPTRLLRVLDIGCGEGKNAVFFARNGYEVSAFDITVSGVEKTKQLAREVGVNIDVFQADILEYRLRDTFDILFSSGALHYIQPSLRKEIFRNYKEHTNQNGLHVFNVFVEKPFIEPAPENEPNAHPWISGELFTHYHDWCIKECSEVIFDCNSSGLPHKHAMNTLIARKPVYHVVHEG